MNRLTLVEFCKQYKYIIDKNKLIQLGYNKQQAEEKIKEYKEEYTKYCSSNNTITSDSFGKGIKGR